MGVAGGLALLAILTRLPFRSQVLFNWDSINFAYATQGFNLAQHRPHPPGYLLYVLLGRLVSHVTRDPNAAFVWLSITAGALTVVATYLFGKDLFTREDALASSVMLLVSPLFWFSNEVALTYAVEGLFSVIVAWASWKAARSARWAYIAVGLLALAMGFRQTTLFVLLPAVVFGLWHLPRRHQLGASLTGAVLALAWLIPLIVESGGARGYIAALAQLSAVTPPSPFADLLRSLFYGANLVLILVIMGCLGLYASHAIVRSKTEGWFFLLWISPGLLLASLRHLGQSGYVLFAVPALFLLAPAAIRAAASRLNEIWRARPGRQQATPRQLMLLTASAICLVGAGGFLLGGLPLIRQQDSRWIYAASLAEAFPPASTIVLSDVPTMGGFRFAGYYLPEYRTYAFISSPVSGPVLVREPPQILGWIFTSYLQQDNYGLDPATHSLHKSLDLPAGTRGLLVTDASILLALSSADDSGSLRFGEPTSLPYDFAFVPVDPHARSIEVFQGNLVLRP